MPHDFLDEDRSYNWYMAARFIFAGQGMSDKQRNKALHKLVDEKILEPRADKSGWLFTGDDLMAFIEKRNKRLEEVRRQKVDALRRDIQELTKIVQEGQGEKNQLALRQTISLLSKSVEGLATLVSELKEQGEG
ncbi:unnamed protein product, partial [marine sediment metagenome]